MKITKYPQSCVLFEYKNKKILIDPGKFVYSQTDMKAEDWKGIDILLLTHKHSDHTVPEAIKIIVENNNPIILTNKEVHDILQEQGINSEILEPRQEKNIEGINIKGIKAEHGPLPPGNPLPDVIGFQIDDKLYHPGDSLLLEDKPSVDILFVPISNKIYTDCKEAVKFVNEIKPKLAIPVHYADPRHNATTDDFEKDMADSNINYKILKNKESIELKWK